MIRGKTGATVFSILDAPDLSRDAELLDRYELDQVGEARYVREQLGAATIGRIKVDDDAFALQPLDAVRVAPGSAREFEAGSAGLEVLAFGSHIPGDGEMVSERPTHE